MPTLYRKYRPQTFAAVTGQEHIVQTITNEIATGKIAHAYLFSGPRGVGKTTTARLLAKAVNCAQRADGDSEPCDQCASCREISAGRNIDVLEIDAASQTGVDNVRENIIENAQFLPTKSKYKVFIIDEAHMLSGGAFNALLKTLEEPPAHVIIILATTELRKLPATVISRCQRFNFKKIPFEEIQKRLENISKEEGVKVDKEVLKRVVGKSDGCLRDAESLLGQLFSLNLKKISADDAQAILPSSNIEAALEYAERLAGQDAAGAIKLINKLAGEGVNLEHFALELLEVLRLAMLGQIGQRLEDYGADYSNETLKRIKKISESLSGARLAELIDRALARRAQIKTAPIPQLPLELLAVECAAVENDKNNNDAAPPPAAPTVSAEISRGDDAEQTAPPPAPAAPAAKRSLGQSIKKVMANIAKTTEIKSSLRDIQNKWPELLKKFSVSNPSLTFILNACSLTKIDGDGLHIWFPYSFHKEKIAEQKTKKIVEDCLGELCAEKIIIVCEVTDTPGAPAVNDAELAGLAAQFGGEVV